MLESQPHAPSDSEVKQLILFLNHSLRPQIKWSIDQEYPLVFCEENRKNLRVISQENEILSHAAFKPLWIRTPLGLFKVATLGNVVTHQHHRRQGLSQKVLQSCLDRAVSENCDFAILWTELYDFYQKLDFELAGYEISFVMEKEFQVPASSFRFIKMDKISPETFLKLYLKHSVYSLRSEEEVKQHLRIPNTSVYTAWDETHQLKAYAIEGKGMDLSKYIHEWGGDVSSLLGLFSYIRRERKTPITLISPAHSQNLIRHLSQYRKEIHRHDGFLGMIRLLNVENLFSKIAKYAFSLGINDFSFQTKNKTHVISMNGKTSKALSMKELTQLIFGSPKKNSGKLPFEMPKGEPQVFPIPMWIWGWDSV